MWVTEWDLEVQDGWRCKMGLHGNSISFVSWRASCLLDLLDLRTLHVTHKIVWWTSQRAVSLFGIPLMAGSICAFCQSSYYTLSQVPAGIYIPVTLLVVWSHPNPIFLTQSIHFLPILETGTYITSEDSGWHKFTQSSSFCIPFYFLFSVQSSPILLLSTAHLHTISKIIISFDMHCFTLNF